mmetsp:Transcript_8519/g.16400  ORF Transcript_8519/g.16400 Transcript_8519/m.16400 type:complete len:121 (+) Transcript_8519:1393-1755(+)
MELVNHSAKDPTGHPTALTLPQSPGPCYKVPIGPATLQAMPQSTHSSCHKTRQAKPQRPHSSCQNKKKDLPLGTLLASTYQQKTPIPHPQHPNHIKPNLSLCTLIADNPRNSTSAPGAGN